MPLRNSDGSLYSAETVRQLMVERKAKVYFPYLGDILGDDWRSHERPGEDFWACALRVARMQYDDYAGHLTGEFLLMPEGRE